MTAFIDLTFTLFPVLIVWKLKLKLKLKVALASLLSLGLL